ncbi:uncharacterized protein LOC124419556 isoform X1 [Lucilia cuprina]|uniref:uncharacterized protein LOC124419556 isoform X1 n=1 Tax=Lucilia cuprina TaxID=7375 RepID=UPI001F05C52C|nr:uncharacterized protein LOC124419556 isoform X1 [Lucilia cuprina]
MEKNRRQFNNSWMKEDWTKGWLVHIEQAPEWSHSGPSHGAWCKVCKVGLQCQKKDLKKHGLTEKHRINLNSLKPSNTVRYGILKTSKESKIFEIRLAMYISTHTSIISVDHLCDLFLKTLQINNKSLTLKMHRTKCSALIKYVIAPTLLEELLMENIL